MKNDDFCPQTRATSKKVFELYYATADGQYHAK
jgi:hypothetical protein